MNFYNHMVVFGLIVMVGCSHPIEKQYKTQTTMTQAKKISSLDVLITSSPGLLACDDFKWGKEHDDGSEYASILDASKNVIDSCKKEEKAFSESFKNKEFTSCGLITNNVISSFFKDQVLYHTEWVKWLDSKKATLTKLMHNQSLLNVCRSFNALCSSRPTRNKYASDDSTLISKYTTIYDVNTISCVEQEVRCLPFHDKESCNVGKILSRIQRGDVASLKTNLE